MKKVLCILAIAGAVVACKNKQAENDSLPDAHETAVTYHPYGEGITAEGAMSEAEMAEKFKNLKSGDTLNVKFSSEVKEVCQNKGCWMKIDLDGDVGMVRFKDYAFFMPKDIAGQEVIVAGKAYIEEMSVEDQRHYAEDAGKTPEEIAAITEPKTTFAFEANGVLIPEVKKQ